MSDGRTLVVIFLRGGLDGVGAVVPHFEDEYHRQRPSLAFSAPKPGTGGDQLIPLGEPRPGQAFALHPALAPLRPSYAEGRLAIVHAFGSDDGTRSHFEAQDQMDHGAGFEKPLGGGWIGRWLRAAGARGAFSAVAFGASMPESLRGAPSACAIESLDDVTVETRSGDAAGFAEALRRLHAPGGATAVDGPSALVRKGARDALALLDRVDEIRSDPAPLGDYPDTGLARSLAQVAQLVRKEVGLRVAAIDHGGFDTHFGQSLAIQGPLSSFAAALAAFERDLGPLMERVTVLCPTEFGRRIYENASLGTDHGRGSCAFVLGGGVRGGRVLGAWPGLEPREEDGEPVDLQVTTDYRDLFWEVLSRQLGAADLGAVFPGHRHKPVGVFG